MFHKCNRSTHPRDRFRAFFFPKKNVFHVKMNCLVTFFCLFVSFRGGGGGGGFFFLFVKKKEGWGGGGGGVTLSTLKYM